MAGETVITIIGNLTADPDMRTTGNGKPVANFTIASMPRTYNRNSNQWDDGQALFLRCAAWNELADHVGTSLAKGMRVIASGRLSQHQYQAQDGSNRTVVEMTVDEIGPSLRYATAQVARANRSTGFNGQQGDSRPSQTAGRAAYQQPPQASPSAPDPWGAPSGEFGGSDDTPQF